MANQEKEYRERWEAMNRDLLYPTRESDQLSERKRELQERNAALRNAVGRWQAYQDAASRKEELQAEIAQLEAENEELFASLDPLEWQFLEKMDIQEGVNLDPRLDLPDTHKLPPDNRERLERDLRR